MPKNPRLSDRVVSNKHNQRVMVGYIKAMWAYAIEFDNELDMQDALELAAKYNSGELLLLN